MHVLHVKRYCLQLVLIIIISIILVTSGQRKCVRLSLNVSLMITCDWIPDIVFAGRFKACGAIAGPSIDNLICFNGAGLITKKKHLFLLL